MSKITHPLNMFFYWLARYKYQAIFAAQFSLIVSVSIFYFYYFQFQSPYITSSDGYYHIKYSYLLRTEGFIRSFKWASLSVLSEKFSDKDFLYHLILIPFTYFNDLAFGIKIATVFFAAITSSCFYLILRLNRVKYSSFWFLLLLISGAFFLYRINSPRPQVISVLLLLWSWHFILNNKRISLGILSFIYCTAYTASFLPLFFAAIASTYRYLFTDELEWKNLLATFVGFLIGMIIHPYFPNNWMLLWVQNFYVLFLQHAHAYLNIAGEIKPMTTRQLLYLNTTTLMAYIMAFFTAMARPLKISSKTGQTFIISLAMLILMAHSKRFTEYAIPFTLMFCAMFFSPYFSLLSRNTLIKNILLYPLKSCVLTLFLVTSTTVLALSTYFSLLPQFQAQQSKYASAAHYLKNIAQEDEVIFTCDWDDAPELWFANSDNRYLVFLDPTFMYYRSKDLWEKWTLTSNGLLGINTYEAMKNIFKIRYGICTSDFKLLHQIIQQDKRMNVIFETNDVYVFRVN